MRRTKFGRSLAPFLVVGWLVPHAIAQETKSAKGTVTAVGADSITVKAGERELKFVIDTKTLLIATGAGTAARKAEAAGKSGPTLAEFVKTGDPVEVSYQEAGGTMRASQIRRVASAGAGGADRRQTIGRIRRTAPSNRSRDRRSPSAARAAAAVPSSSLYSIDATTRVVAAGASTAPGKQARLRLATSSASRSGDGYLTGRWTPPPRGRRTRQGEAEVARLRLRPPRHVRRGVLRLAGSSCWVCPACAARGDRAQKFRDRAGLPRQEMAFVRQVRQVQIRHLPFHPFARLLRSNQGIPAAKNQLNRHRERRQLAIRPVGSVSCAAGSVERPRTKRLPAPSSGSASHCCWCSHIRSIPRSRRGRSI